MAGFNGSGLFVRTYNWVTDKGNNVKITASRMDTEDDGFATGLSTTICSDGQSTTTAVIPFAVGIRISDGTVGSPSIGWINDTDSGFYRIGSNNVGLALAGAKVWDFGTATTSAATRLIANGAVPAGSLHMFVVDTGTIGSAGTGTGWQYLECDGGTWNVSDFPTLGALLRTSAGAATFVTPDMYTSGLFPRSRTASVTVRTTQSGQNLTHTHGAGTLASDSNGSHSHNGSDIGVGGAQSADLSKQGSQFTPGSASSGSAYILLTGSSASPTALSAAVVDHDHTLAIASDGAHTHTVSGNTGNSTNSGTEVRPANVSVIFAVKT